MGVKKEMSVGDTVTVKSTGEVGRVVDFEIDPTGEPRWALDIDDEHWYYENDIEPR